MTISYTPVVDDRDKKAKAQERVESAVRTHANQVLSFAKCAFILSNFNNSPRNEFALVVGWGPFGSSKIISLFDVRCSALKIDPSGRY